MRLHMPELLYIGHRISGNGVKPEPLKVVAIKGKVSIRCAEVLRNVQLSGKIHPKPLSGLRTAEAFDGG